MDSDDEPDYVPPYDCTDPANEPLPDDVTYQPIFAELEEKSGVATKLLEEPLRKSEYQSSIIVGLLEEISTRTKKESSKELMIAVAGDMATGKSSVINSIFGIGTIARKGDGGGSCTWVVQRFMKTFPDQMAPFAARVYFFSSVEIKNILASLLEKYYQASGRNRDDDEEDESKEDKMENYNDIRTVLDTFMALFCVYPEFKSEERAKAFLNDASAEDDEDTLETLFTYAEEIVTNFSEGQDFVPVEASTADDVLFELRKYTHTVARKGGKPDQSPWPLVSRVDFGLNHPLTDQGIIIIDSPGLSDANSTRADNAKFYHSQCTRLITVAEIGRAQDDTALRQSLLLEYVTRGSGNTMLVLTHGDQFDSEDDIPGDRHEKRREQALKDELKVLDADMTKLKNRRPKMSRTEKLDLEDELRALDAKTEKKERKLNALRMGMRNRNVVENVQEQYRDFSGDPKPLSAFVVGNQAYKQHHVGYSSRNRPKLTVKETGVLALRHRIFSLPLEGRLNDALHLAETQLPSLINSLELYCAKGPMASKDEIEAIIATQREYVKGSTGLVTEKLNTEVHKCIWKPMRNYESQWIKEARDIRRGWKMTLPTLRKHGYKMNRKKGETDTRWNAELLKYRRGDIEELYSDLLKATIPPFDELKDGIRHEQFNLMALNRYIESFTHEKKNAYNRIELALRRLRHSLGLILHKVLSGEQDSIMSQAMAPVYKEVLKISGKGAVKRREAELEKQLTKTSGVWTTFQDLTRTAFESPIQYTVEQLRLELESIFNGLLQKFNLLCEDTMTKTEDEKAQEEELRQELEKNLIKARELVNGPIYELAHQCKNYSKMKEEKSLFFPSE